MDQIADIARYPFDTPGGAAWAALKSRAMDDLAQHGMFTLDGLMRPDAVAASIAGLRTAMDQDSFEHRRWHNIYFKRDVPGLEPGHPALKEVETVNHTLCADQLTGNPVLEVYAWPGLIRFLAEVMGKPKLHVMDDPLARVNVMEYRAGEALNWHFDRSEFTTTLLLQAPAEGGAFEYRTDLRSPDDPNYGGVARLLEGKDAQVESLTLKAGSLNVFKGVNTAHRVQPVAGGKGRIIAVFSYYDRPGVRFSAAEQQGFYGRTA